MNEPKPTNIQENDLKNLQSTIKTLKTTVTEQKNLLNAKSKQMKDSSKLVEEQVADLREEIIKVKHESARFQTNIKNLEDDLAMSKAEKENVKYENGKMFTALKTYETEVEVLKKDRDSLEQELGKKKQIFNCDKCGYSATSQCDFKKHVQAQHLKNKCNQTEVFNLVDTEKHEFSEYPCHYCRKTIKSEKDLEEHKLVCYTSKDLALYPCDICGAQCTDMMDFERHRTTHHPQDLREHFKNENPYFNEEELNSCDFCGLQFGTLGCLRNHIRNQHKEMLPI